MGRRRQRRTKMNRKSKRSKTTEYRPERTIKEKFGRLSNTILQERIQKSSNDVLVTR